MSIYRRRPQESQTHTIFIGFFNPRRTRKQA
jgi:hypothetical protein